MPSPPSYGCCTRVNFVLKKHLLFQMNLSNSGLKNRSIKEYWLIFTVLKFPLGLQFSHNLTKFKIIKYISTIYIMTTTCTYLQQLTQVSDVAHGPLVIQKFFSAKTVAPDQMPGLQIRGSIKDNSKIIFLIAQHCSTKTYIVTLFRTVSARQF